MQNQYKNGTGKFWQLDCKGVILISQGGINNKRVVTIGSTFDTIKWLAFIQTVATR